MMRNVTLTDEHGAEHGVQIDEGDWNAANAFAHGWRIIRARDKLQVVSSAGRSILHRNRSWFHMHLSLANFIMEPRRGHTVRFLNGNTLDLRRENLIVMRSGKALKLSAQGERELSLSEMEHAAIEAAERDGRDVQEALCAAQDAHKQRTKDKAAATRAANAARRAA